MTLNSVVDVSIGLIFMYLVLSLLCTVINEYIATIFSLRAKALAQGIKLLIDDSALHQQFSAHGLVDGAKCAAGSGGPSYLDSRVFAMALVASVDPSKPVPAYEDVQQGMQRLPDSNIRDTLLSQVATTQGDMQKLQDNVAAWFDHSMDRLSGLYKRWLKFLSFGVGLALAVAINADTLSVAKVLWNDPTVRSQFVCVAERPPAPGANFSDVLKSSVNELEMIRSLPIGWPMGRTEYDADQISLWKIIPDKVLGLLLTALSISLGAPFWFDLLSKFMNIRGSGARPDRMVPAT